jgi:uncharacterized protein YtpQ (UPF0354 family)
MKWLALILFAAGLAYLVVGLTARRRALKSFKLSPAARDRVKPRLVTLAFHEKMRAKLGAFPSRDFYGLPLKVVYVLDADKQMMYLSDAHLKKLGLAPADIHKVALTNLWPSIPPTLGADVLAKNSMVVLKNLDGFDAARLLLVPATLQAGQRLAAIISDRDTLALLPVPDQWSSLEEMAKTSVGEPLFA